MQESKQHPCFTFFEIRPKWQVVVDWLLFPDGPTDVCDVPDGLTVTPADLAMIAKDGPARPKTCTCGEPHSQGVIHRTDGPCYFKAQPSTTKPPIAGLTRVSAQDHRVGGWGFVR